MIEMRLDTFLIGLLTFSIFITGGVLIWGHTISNYDINTTTEGEGANFTGVYDIINDSYDLGQDIENRTLYAEIEGGDSSWESMIKGSYGAIRLVKNSFSLVGEILNAIALQIGIPRFFVTFGIIAISILITFSIIYLVFRFKG